MKMISVLEKGAILAIVFIALFSVSFNTVLAAPAGHGNQQNNGNNNHGGQQGDNNNHDNDHHDQDNHGDNDNNHDEHHHEQGDDSHHGDGHHGDDCSVGTHYEDGSCVVDPVEPCEIEGQVRVDGECQDPVVVEISTEESTGHHSAPISSYYKDKSKAERAGKVLGAEKFQFNNNLRLGMTTQPDVTELQNRLRAEGFFTASDEDGRFGAATFAAVKAYQTAHSAIGYVTGYFGPLTRAEMNAY